MSSKYSAIMSGHAAGILKQVFGEEWIKLERGTAVVIEDFLDASIEDNIGAREYQRRIGAGNLQAYADTLLAGKARAAK